MEKLVSVLEELKQDHGLIAFKGGTEVEDMTYEEISLLNELGGSDLPLTVKIGGPEARNDMRALKRLGVFGILAPMIESEYALKNFVMSINDIYDGVPKPSLAINIETKTGYLNLGNILKNKYFESIDQVTIGRSDLSGSMDRNVDDEIVFAVVRDIVSQVREYGKITSVGGSLNPLNAQVVRELIRPDRVNTRHLIFSFSSGSNLYAAIKRGLEFEILLYHRLADVEPSKADAYSKRIAVASQRLENVLQPAEQRVS